MKFANEIHQEENMKTPLRIGNKAFTLSKTPLEKNKINNK